MTVEQIKAMAEKACFYVTPEGLWLRIIYCADAGFSADDEDSGEEYDIPYDDITFEGNECFQKLVKMEIE